MGGDGSIKFTCKSSDGSACVNIPDLPGTPASCSATSDADFTYTEASSCDVGSGRSYCIAELTEDGVTATTCYHTSSSLFTCSTLSSFMPSTVGTFTEGTQDQCNTANMVMNLDAMMML
jgi:hypothetical protein